MLKIKKRIIFIILIIMLVFIKSKVVYADIVDFTNIPVTGTNKVNFYNLTTKEGLSNNVITNIFQDSKGYMWIGTKDGLNKYNGNMVVVYDYDRNDENSLSSPWIKSINEDKDGNIWVGTNGGLSIINGDKGTVKRVGSKVESDTNLSSSIITAIYRDSNEVMWVGTENGLNRYDEKNNKFIKYYSDDTQESIVNNYITDIDEDSLGYLWVSTINGITQINLDTYEINNEKNQYSNNNYIYKLDKDQNGEIWCVSEKGLLRNIVGEYKLNNYLINDIENANNDINNILCDSNNNVWLGTLGGLIKYSPSQKVTEIYTVEKNSYNYLLSNVITCLYEDRNGVIWIGTDNGISILNTKQQFSNRINTLLEEEGVYESSITAFLVDKDNDLWIGTAEYGLIFFDISENNKIRFENSIDSEKPLLSNNIKALEIGTNNKIIVGTGKGINIINKETGEVSSCDEEKKKILFFNRGLHMLNDGEYIWAASMEGLYKSNNQTKEISCLNDKLINSYDIFDIFQDKNDEDILWLAGGRKSGLIKFHKENGIVKNYLLDLDNNLSSYNAINCIEGDEEGNIWIGTESGLYKFNIQEENFTIYFERDGLRSDYINSIIIDNNKDVWLGTNDGLSKFIIDENRFINFTEIDGIYGSQFNKNVAYKTSKGHLLFGTTKGVVSFHPNNINDIISNDNKVSLNNIWINRELYSGENDYMELKYNENGITIEYFIPDYSKIGGISYLYKMEGVNEEWIAGNRDGYVVYTMLKPGKYVFRVKAVMSDGSITEESTITFKINKPFWKSTTAYCIYIFCISIITIISLKRVQILKLLVNNQTKQINRQMEENKILYERTLKNEKFKNDYFVNLSHELRTPINIIISALQLLNSLNKNEKDDEEKISHYMNVIKKSSNSLLNIINDIIDSSKIESGAYKIKKEDNIDIIYLVEETALNMSDYIKEKGIELIIDPEIEELPICCDPKEIERCIVNLVGNAVKFTEENGQINILIRQEEENVIISVIDTGIGISKEDQEFIFKRFEQGKNFNSIQVSSSGIGLTLVKYIVELHGGYVTLESELDKGSKFTVTLPIK